MIEHSNFPCNSLDHVFISSSHALLRRLALNKLEEHLNMISSDRALSHVCDTEVETLMHSECVTLSLVEMMLHCVNTHNASPADVGIAGQSNRPVGDCGHELDLEDVAEVRDPGLAHLQHGATEPQEQPEAVEQEPSEQQEQHNCMHSMLLPDLVGHASPSDLMGHASPNGLACHTSQPSHQSQIVASTPLKRKRSSVDYAAMANGGE